jgi:hypothetical protein
LYPKKLLKMPKVTKKAEPAKKETNKDLEKMLKLVATAKKEKKSEVVVFKTEEKHYKKKKEGDMGFGSEDLKPKLYEAYKHMLCKFDVRTRIINLDTKEVEWFVKLK